MVSVTDTSAVPITPGPKRWVVSSWTVVLPWILVLILTVTNVVTAISPSLRFAEVRAGTTILEKLAESFSLLPFFDKTAGESTQSSKTITELRRQNAQLLERQTKMTSAFSALQRETNDVKAQKTAAEVRFDKLRSEHMQLQQVKTALESEQAASKALALKRAKAVHDVSSYFMRKMAAHAGAMIAELPLRAAPYVGTVALVAAMSADIRMDCEMTRALNTLVLEHQGQPIDTNAVCQYIDKIPSGAQVWIAVQNGAHTLVKPLHQAIARVYTDRAIR